jgi:predicted DNA-binding transcriptional regulator AlpA
MAPSNKKGSMGITTPEVCKRLGISRATLHFWIRLGRVAAPPRTTIGKITARRWTELQIAEVRKLGGLKRGRPRGLRFPQGYKKNAN